MRSNMIVYRGYRIYKLKNGRISVPGMYAHFATLTQAVKCIRRAVPGGWTPDFG